MPSPRALILGATGMLGKMLVKEAKVRGYSVTGAARSDGDVACDLSDPDSCSEVFLRAQPDLLINAAAITDFPLCEREPALALRVNGVAP